MVYVSHDAGEVKRIATAVVRIDAGRVVATGGKEPARCGDGRMRSEYMLYCVCSRPNASSA